MKKLITVILVVAILVLAVNHAMPIINNRVMPLIRYQLTGFAYVDEDVDILNPEKFEDLFGQKSADKICYNYLLTPYYDDDKTAHVTIDLEMYAGDAVFTAHGSGNIKQNKLPSGNILYEGPVDGGITVGDITFDITFYFVSVENSYDVGISFTYSPKGCGASFGDLVFEGEVQDFYDRMFGK